MRRWVPWWTTILAEQGRIDVLVNNAGYGSYGAVEDVPMAEARRQLDVNLFGLARLTQLVLPTMRQARRGRIINISSIGGRMGEPLGAWYHASKFAVEGFSDSLRLELHDFDIHVVIVEPGAIRTEWGDGALQSARTYSAETAYAAHVAAMDRMYASAYDFAVEPAVIADVIHRAATARRPKIRYAAPTSAKVLMALTRLMPDRLKDGAARRMMLGGPVDVDSVPLSCPELGHSTTLAAGAGQTQPVPRSRRRHRPGRPAPTYPHDGREAGHAKSGDCRLPACPADRPRYLMTASSPAPPANTRNSHQP